jgi:hypothetical protein
MLEDRAGVSAPPIYNFLGFLHGLLVPMIRTGLTVKNEIDILVNFNRECC